MITLHPTNLGFSIYFQPVHISYGTQGCLQSLRKYYRTVVRICGAFLHLVFYRESVLLVKDASLRSIIRSSRTTNGRGGLKFACCIGGAS